MKIDILDKEGKKSKEMETNLFEEVIREDLMLKVIEAEKLKEPHSPKYKAGMDSSASGKIKHRRHVWKTSYGRGMSRVPRKAMSRRGTQFSWEGASIPSVKGGRRAHPPKGAGRLRKINKKELKKAFLSALSYVNEIKEIKKKYSSIGDRDINNKLPIIFDKKIMELKSKDFFELLKKVLNELNSIAIQKKTIRAGKGKIRGRKNKKNAGLLFVIGKGEMKRISGIEVMNTDSLLVKDLAENGARLTIFTEDAIKDLENLTK